jgi:CheY-like chemotaxis protein
MPTALIVEDEIEANKLLAMLVQLRGYQTDSAYDGAQALTKVRSLKPDVVFLDLMLPDLDGYDVCRSLKSAGSTSQIPVIIVTARIAAENRIDSFRAGADDYVPKPYTPAQIYQALDRSDAWRRQIASPQVHDRVVLDGQDDGNALRGLAQIRSLLLARSKLARAAIDGIISTIAAIWASVDTSAREPGQERAATLEYLLTADSLTVMVDDEGGGSGGFGGDEFNTLLAGAPFDEIIALEPARTLKLVKRFDPV